MRCTALRIDARFRGTIESTVGAESVVRVALPREVSGWLVLVRDAERGLVERALVRLLGGEVVFVRREWGAPDEVPRALSGRLGRAAASAWVAALSTMCLPLPGSLRVAMIGAAAMGAFVFPRARRASTAPTTF